MGKRARRRGPVQRTDPRAKPERQSWADRFAAAADERPKAPWHPFPLIELCVLAGIVLIVVGFIKFDDRDGRFMLLLGLVLSSLAGLDTAVRDHFSGFRSHNLLLAGVPTVLTAGSFFFLKVPWPVITVSAVVVFTLALWWFRSRFQERSGGLSFRA